MAWIGGIPSLYLRPGCIHGVTDSRLPRGEHDGISGSWPPPPRRVVRRAVFSLAISGPTRAGNMVKTDILGARDTEQAIHWYVGVGDGTSSMPECFIGQAVMHSAHRRHSFSHRINPSREMHDP